MTEYKHLIESKSQVVSLIPGKPYPEDYGTTVEKVREFLEEDGFDLLAISKSQDISVWEKYSSFREYSGETKHD